MKIVIIVIAIWFWSSICFGFGYILGVMIAKNKLTEEQANEDI